MAKYIKDDGALQGCLAAKECTLHSINEEVAPCFGDATLEFGEADCRRMGALCARGKRGSWR